MSRRPDEQQQNGASREVYRRLASGELDSDTYFRTLSRLSPEKGEDADWRLLANILVTAVRHSDESPTRNLDEPTEREIEVMRYAALGFTVQGTAEALRITYETVRTHRKAVIRKLGARNLTHAVALWVGGNDG